MGTGISRTQSQFPIATGIDPDKPPGLTRWVPGWLWPLAICGTCILLALGRLVVCPDGLIVDADQAAVDSSIPAFRRTPGNDLTRLFLPHHLSISQALHQTGRIPSWDARGFGGRPLVGNPQAGLWYPPVWIFWIWQAPGLFGWLTVAHLIGGGAGLIALGRRLGVCQWAQAVCGTVFALNPYMVAQVAAGHLPQVWAACWVPWIVLAAWVWTLGDYRGGLAFGPLLALCMLTGHPHVPFLLVTGLGTWFAVDRIWRNPGRMTPRAWAVSGVLLVLPVVLTAVEWVPDLLVEPWTLGRTRQQTSETDRYAVGLGNIWQLADPLALGGPAGYLGTGNYWETQIGVGGPVLVLAVLAWILAPQRRKFLSAWLLIAVFAAWWLAAGRAGGLANLVGTIWPGMSRFRVPGRVLFLIAPAVAMLAGLGIQALLQRGRTGRALAMALGGVALIHLAVEGWLILKVAPAERFLKPDRAAQLLLANLPNEPFRVRARDALFPDLQATRLGIDKTNVEDWFQIQHAADLYETLYPIFDPPRPVEWMNPLNSWVLAQVRQGVLDRLNVARLISDEAPRGLKTPVLAQSPGEPAILLLDNPTALPRAYVVPRALPANPKQDPVMEMAWINPREAVLMRTNPMDLEPGARQPFQPASFQSLTPDHLKIAVQTQAPGLLVVAETWMPGWSASVNGRTVPVLRGNHAQIVIPLPVPGQYAMELKYHPPGLWIGIACTIIGMVSWTFLAFGLCGQFAKRQELRPISQTWQSI